MYKRELHSPEVKFRHRHKIYTDPLRHEQHWAWLRKKAQAQYRKEDWGLTIDEWFDLWDASGQWENRGRHPNASAVFMIDPELGWHIWNVEVVNRSEALKQRQGKRMGGRQNGN